MLRKLILASIFCCALFGVSYGQSGDKQPIDKEKPKCTPDVCRPEPRCPPEKVPVEKPVDKEQKLPKEKPLLDLIEVKTKLPSKECLF
jgi:hypothetical protein